MSVTVMGQIPDDVPGPSLRIGEATADSFVVYYASGEKAWSMLDVWEEPVCRVFADDKSEPGKFLVHVGITPDFRNRVTYIFDSGTTETTYEGTRLSSLTYRKKTYMDPPSPPYAIRRINYTYNETGQIVSIEERDENSNIHDQDFFSYDENGDLMSYEQTFWWWAYNGDTGMPISGTGKVAVVNSQVWKFGSQGRKTGRYAYRNNFIYSDEPKGKHLQDYAIFYYSDGYTPNVDTGDNNPIDDTNKGRFDIIINLPIDSIAGGSFVIKLPDGFMLDETNTRLSIDFGDFTLVITKQEDNSWLLEIKPKNTRSAALRSEDISRALAHIAYTVNGQVKRGTYDVTVHSILFETPGGDAIVEPALTVPVQLNRWGVGNETIVPPTIWSHGNTLYIRTPQPATLNIYTLTGTLFRQQILPAGETAITLPPGTYFVQTGKTVKKILIR
jgi:hypothetical protein